MKVLLMSLLTLTTFNQAWSQATPTDQLFNQMMKLNNKVGKLLTNYENAHSGRCLIKIERNGRDYKIQFKDTAMYFEPLTYIKTSEVEVLSNNEILVSENPERPGGDVCGDAGGATRYKQTVFVTAERISLKESYRCTYEGFKKYELESSCIIIK